MVSPSSRDAGHARRLAAIDLLHLDIEEFGLEKRCQRLRQPVGIGDDAVADAERPLGRLHEAMDVVEALGLADTQPREQCQDNERGQPLGRRRRIIERAGIDA